MNAKAKKKTCSKSKHLESTTNIKFNKRECREQNKSSLQTVKISKMVCCFFFVRVFFDANTSYVSHADQTVWFNFRPACYTCDCCRLLFSFRAWNVSFVVTWNRTCSVRSESRVDVLTKLKCNCESKSVLIEPEPKTQWCEIITKFRIQFRWQFILNSNFFLENGVDTFTTIKTILISLTCISIESDWLIEGKTVRAHNSTGI